MTEKKKADPQSRSWLLTIPCKDVPTLDELLAILDEWPAAGQREKGLDTGYEHWQVYLHRPPSAFRFSTLKKRFPTAHMEQRKGSHSQAFWYCMKDDDTFAGDRFNTGIPEPPRPKEGLSGISTLEELHGLILEGSATVDELLTGSHKSVAHWRGLREVEGVLMKKRFATKTRVLDVHYIYGGAGVGKTHWVYEKEGYDSVYAPGSYKNPWDNYAGQPVLLLDEFNGQIEFEFLLKVLDKYPLLLPARYSDRWAGYERVYIISNLSLSEMYPSVQADPSRSRQWDALLRRIDHYAEMVERGVLEERAKPHARTIPVESVDWSALDW